LNAAAKIIAAIVYMVVLFIVNTWVAWGILTAAALAVVIVAKLPFSAVWRGMKIIFVFCIFTLLINLFFYPGDPLLTIGFIKITKNGVYYGLAMSLRLLLLVLFGSLLTLTTKPMELTDAMESLLKPLRLLHVQTHEAAMMLSIALRFIPTILEEFDRIVLAQRARGATVSQGNIFRRIKAFIPMLVPLFVAAFRRAEDLATAMEAKCYQGGAGRTKWHVAAWRTCDTLTVLLSCAVFAGAIVYRSMC
ncbi:MAG: energy-coupling factor transporter transmembrane protein EcfT, partial [Firmicutes bacterium]|nr:energy-coupling factor transporter transmembrane protein EcfT [Bacillota bacterium]